MRCSSQYGKSARETSPEYPIRWVPTDREGGTSVSYQDRGHGNRRTDYHDLFTCSNTRFTGCHGPLDTPCFNLLRQVSSVTPIPQLGCHGLLASPCLTTHHRPFCIGVPRTACQSVLGPHNQAHPSRAMHTTRSNVEPSIPARSCDRSLASARAVRLATTSPVAMN